MAETAWMGPALEGLPLWERAKALDAVEAHARRRLAAQRYPTPGHLAVNLMPGTVQTPALAAIDQALIDADAGRQRRWVVNMPPQEGKTERCAQLGALWFLLRNPERRVVVASYEQGIAERSGSEVKRLIDRYGTRPGDPDEDDRLGLRVDPKHTAARNWRLDGHRGGMVSVGVGSALTGRPADVVVVDDPLKDPEQADSGVYQEKVVDWYAAVVEPRLVATSIAVVIQTRWNEADLSGWLLQQDRLRAERRWATLVVPALAEPGDQLGRPPGTWLQSARRRTPAEWEAIREVTPARWWYALYQQRPAPPGGGTFKTEWFDRDRVAAPPAGLLPGWVVVDPADNTGAGDEAGIIVAAGHPTEGVFLLADYSGHYTTARWVRRALLAAAGHGAVTVAYEKSLSGLGRAMRAGWTELRKQARALKRRAGNGHTMHAAVTAAVGELSHPDDDPDARDQLVVDLLELWPLVDAVLAFPDSGPNVHPIAPAGSKQHRMMLAASPYQMRRVHHVGPPAMWGPLEHQLSTWMEGQDSPDRADAAVYAVLLLSSSSPMTLAAPHATVPTRSSTLRRPVGPIQRSTR